MVYTWRHNLTVAWNQEPGNDLTDDFFPPMAEQLQDQLSGPIEPGYRQNRQVLVVLESLGASQMRQHDYRGAIDTGKALIELAYPFQGLCMVGDAAWALGRAYEALDYYEEARRGLVEGVDERPLQTVRQRLAAVQDYLAKRKDPMTTLSEDICRRIFSHLDWQQDRTTCARVSPVWRNRILGAPVWETLNLSLVDGVEQRIPPAELENYLQPQLQHVHIVSNGGVEPFLHKLQRNGCTRLKRMTIIAPHYARLLSASFLNSLQAISDHLVDLHIQCPGVNQPVMMLEMLLQCCPSLTCLQFRAMGSATFDIPYQPTGSSLTRCTSLQCLHWPVGREDAVFQLLDSLKTFCPDLAHLFLETQSSALDGLDISHSMRNLRHLPLKTLIIGRYGGTFACSDEGAQDAASPSSRVNALERFVLSNVCIDQSTLRTFLVVNQSTLKEMDVMQQGPRHQVGVSEGGLRWDFPKLTSARFWQDVPASRDHASIMEDEAIPAFILQPLDAFLDGSPRLESLALPFTHLGGGCVDALSRIKQLELIQLGRNILDGDTLFELARHPQSAIEHLTLTVHMERDAYEALFVELGRMPRLCELSYFNRMACCGIRASALEAFIQRARQSGLTRRLTKLMFRGEGAPVEARVKDEFPFLTEIEIGGQHA